MPNLLGRTGKSGKLKLQGVKLLLPVAVFETLFKWESRTHTFSLTSCYLLECGRYFLRPKTWPQGKAVWRAFIFLSKILFSDCSARKSRFSDHSYSMYLRFFTVFAIGRVNEEKAVELCWCKWLKESPT